MTAPSVRLRGCHMPSLEATLLNTNMLMADAGFSAKWVRVAGANITGPVDLSAALLDNPGQVAFEGSGMKVGWYLHLSSGFVAHGQIRLVGAQVGGSISFTGATLHHPGQWAIDAQSATIGFALFLGSTLSDPRGFRAVGGVRLVNARISGFLCCWQAVIENPTGLAISAEGLKVSEQVLLNRDFTARGTVSLDGACIGGDIRLRRATFDTVGGTALSAVRLKTDASIWLDEGLTVKGRMDLSGSKIGGLVDLTGADLAGCPELDLSGMHSYALVMRPRAAPIQADLQHADVTVLIDDVVAWPSAELQDFTYEQIGDIGEPPVKARIAWLRRNRSGYSPQPYEHLSAIYRRAGHERAARQVAIAKWRHQRKALGLVGKAWNVLLDVTVGYGYRTWQAGVWLLIMVVAGGQAFTVNRSDIVAIRQPAPTFNAYAFALDLVIPVLNLGLKSTWVARGSMAYIGWSLTAAGWVLTTAVVAGLTKLIKRD